MDTARYIVALITIVPVPSAIIFWLLVHPNVRLWRRLGPWLSYAILVTVSVLIALAVYRLRGPILAIDFGANYLLMPFAAAAYALAVWVSVRVRRHLTFRMFVGVPELSGEEGGGRLLTEGLYGRIRHPRYVAVLLGLVAMALFANYLALYVLLVVAAPGLYAIVRLEEKELADRFGEEYAHYRARVPMFVPRSRPLSRGV
jgi:protein-S-isoprenylcysteine O-methyltransferase Ste14